MRICHGHEFDKYNDPERSMLVGRIITLGVGAAEMKFGTKIGGISLERLLGLLEPIGRVVLAFIAWVYRSWFCKTAGRKVKKGKKINETRVALDKYRLEHPTQLLIAGHTHKAGVYGDWYINAGCWQTEQAHYVKITPDGEVTLRIWPGNEVDNTKLWTEPADG